MDDPKAPEGVAIFRTDNDDHTCTLIHFDERVVARRYDVRFEEDGFTWSRDGAFAQRCHVTIAKDGRTMHGEA